MTKFAALCESKTLPKTTDVSDMTNDLDSNLISRVSARHTSCMVIALLLVVSGCTQEMANQPRVDVMEPAKFEFMTPSNRTPVPGTIARGQRWEITPETTGRDGDQLVAKIPVPVTAELVKRGQERFNIYCSACHGMTGSGDGLVVQRGFPAPPSYHIERLQNVSDGHMYVTIKDGLGRMPQFGNRISIEDRWAIVSYIRALQLSQNAKADTLSEADLQNLK